MKIGLMNKISHILFYLCFAVFASNSLKAGRESALQKPQLSQSSEEARWQKAAWNGQKEMVYLLLLQQRFSLPKGRKKARSATPTVKEVKRLFEDQKSR